MGNSLSNPLNSVLWYDIKNITKKFAGIKKLSTIFFHQNYFEIKTQMTHTYFHNFHRVFMKFQLSFSTLLKVNIVQVKYIFSL